MTDAENMMENPNILGDPDKAVDAGDPEQPGRSGDSEEPGTSGNSQEPDRSGDPEEPGRSGDSEEPGTSGNSQEPDRSGDPEEPGRSGDSEEPGTSGNSQEPDRSGDPEQPGRSGDSEEPGTSGNSQEPDRSGDPEQPGRSGDSGEQGAAEEDSEEPVEISLVEHECQRYCSSESHASSLTAALTKDSLEDKHIAAYWKWCCVRYHQAVDRTGRTLVHMAAAKGRTKLLKYLLNHEGIDIQRKDKESNFTPLHCALFYGNLDCAVQLIKAGASLDELDADKLSPLDHICLDNGNLSYREFDTCPHDVYVWGANENFTLGVGDGRRRSTPDALEFFKRQKVHISQIALGKYHSAFLSRDGRLYMCGQGYGGRLGLEEESHVLTPKPIIICSNNPECVSVALGRDHTVVVMADKTVWSFGQNNYHQLGHDPPPDKVMRPKFVRGLRHVGVIGASASTYHSAFWTETRLYTCGLNGGQLGHSRDAGATVVIPKAVSGLRQCSIKVVTCTVGATILANSYGEIYLFYRYICRKITSRPFYPKLLYALGGQLDYKLDSEMLHPNGGRELEVMVVTSCSSVYIWKESDRRYVKYDLGLEQRIMNIVDVTFHSSFCMIVTRDGKAFFGKVVGNRSFGTEINSDSSRNYIELTRVPLIHRAVSMASDPRGSNYAIIQYQPKCRLPVFPRPTQSEADTHLRNLYRVLERASYLQDVEFEVKGVRIPAHRYIVASGSKVLENMMNEAVQPDGSCVVHIENVMPKVFRALLCFIYTRDYNLITPFPNGNSRTHEEMKLPFEFNGKKYMPIREPPMTGKEKAIYLKALEKAARRFAVKGLLDDTTTPEGVTKKAKNSQTGHVRFDRERFQNLWDTILASEDGTQIRAHKCILIARLEYFNSMMNNKRWRESAKNELIDLPLPGEVLTILISYLYTGTAPAILKSEDLDLVFITLIASDQLFCEGLKNICEFTLGNLMNLDNAAEIFQIGLFYNAGNLKQYALEFIIQNLGYMLEKGVLEGLHDIVLTALSKYYRERVPQMSTRRITAFSNAPDQYLIELIGKTEPVNIEVGKDKIPGIPTTSTNDADAAQDSQSENEEEEGPKTGPNEKDEQSEVETNAKPQEEETKEEAKSLPEEAKADPDPAQEEKSDEAQEEKSDEAKEEKSDEAEEGPGEASSDVQAPSTSGESPPESKPTAEGEEAASPPTASSEKAAADGKDPESPEKEEKSVGEEGSKSEESEEPKPPPLSPRHLSESDFPDETDSSEEQSTNEESSARGREEGQEEPFDAASRRPVPKTLADIQAEERAIKELRAHYNADTIREERVSVRRMDCRRRRPRPRTSARS